MNPQIPAIGSHEGSAKLLKLLKDDLPNLKQFSYAPTFGDASEMRFMKNHFNMKTLHGFWVINGVNCKKSSTIGACFLPNH